MKRSALLMAVLLACAVPAMADALDDKYEALKAAVASKDAPQVKTITQELFPLVTSAICETAPEDAEEKEAWSSRVEHAKGVGRYAEYALYATAVVSAPATLVDLISSLEQENPKSPYLATAYGPYLVALSRTGAGAKTVAIAEKALPNFPENEDLLLFLADSSASRNQSDRALTFANRLVASLSKGRKPEGVPAAQWESKRNNGLGRGYWISGVIYGERNQHFNADKNLRAALPLIQGNSAMMAAALFYLGTANYQLGKMTLSKARVLEGAQFSQQCAMISSVYLDQARHNALVMKNEAARMR